MPLLESDYDQKFIRVKGADTVSQALAALLEQGGEDDWDVLVEWPDNKLGVLSVYRLKALLTQLGPALFDVTFDQLKAHVPKATVAPISISIGTVKNWITHESQGVLIVMDDEKIVGRIFDGVKRGSDPFPASTANQLYGDYVNTHPDARANWRPARLVPPTCPHCEHVGFYRYRVADGTQYCDACKQTV